MTDPLDNVRHVHFVGIGGIGMSALARYLLARGYTVSGSDQAPGEQGESLRALGATIYAGHDAQNIGSADLVVITSAVRDGNPELEAARGQGRPVIKRAALLGAIAGQNRAIAVAGTHGKTTTSGLIGHLLLDAGLDPTILIGGIIHSLGSNARTGQGEYIVVEADEYDASFLHIVPEIGIILNVEAEHLDFYGTPERVTDAFRAFASQITGGLIACADDPGALEVARSSPVPVTTYGIDAGDLRATDIDLGVEHTSFTVSGVPYTTQLAGLHNVRNCLAAIAVGRALSLPADALARGIASYTGTARRAERIGEVHDILVLDDYGHHPTEVAATLGALKDRYHRPLRVIFQPHTYSRTVAFLTDFATAFTPADAVYLMDIYAARETDTLGISGTDLANTVSRHHARVRYTPTAQEALDAVLADARPGDIIVTMGAGNVTALAPRILHHLDQP